MSVAPNPVLAIVIDAPLALDVNVLMSFILMSFIWFFKSVAILLRDEESVTLWDIVVFPSRIMDITSSFSGVPENSRVTCPNWASEPILSFRVMVSLIKPAPLIDWLKPIAPPEPLRLNPLGFEIVIFVLSSTTTDADPPLSLNALSVALIAATKLVATWLA